MMAEKECEVLENTEDEDQKAIRVQEKEVGKKTTETNT
jgi:hypothetical protein